MTPQVKASINDFAVFLLRTQLEDHRHRTFPQLGGVLLP
jgi:hypothetical protein